MTDTMNVGFENYVVFHRGIADIYTDPNDNHLIVVYQDGTRHDFGKPFSDEAIAKAAEAEALINQLQTLIDNNKVAEANAAKEALDQAIAAANELNTQNNVGTQAFNEAVNEIVDTTVTESIQAIEGVQSKEVADEQGNTTTVYYVDIAKATNDEIDALFDEEE